MNHKREKEILEEQVQKSVQMNQDKKDLQQIYGMIEDKAKMTQHMSDAWFNKL